MNPLHLRLELSPVDRRLSPFACASMSGPVSYLLRREEGESRDCTLDWDQGLSQHLTAWASGAGTAEVPAEVGLRLRQFLLPTGWEDRHAGAVAHAREEERPILLSLRFEAAELYALPWELLPLACTGLRVADVPRLTMRYAWPGTESEPEAPQPRPEGGRILFAWSAAGGMVPWQGHAAAIAAACSAGELPHDPGRDVLADADLAGIDARLAEAESREEPYAVLHLLCHVGLAAPRSAWRSARRRNGRWSIRPASPWCWAVAPPPCAWWWSWRAARAIRGCRGTRWAA